MRNRWYSPRLGQFITHDPLGYVDTHNLYAYVAFDPINFLDPYGLKSTGGLGGKPLTEEEKQFLKFATPRDPNRVVDPSDLGEGAAKEVGNQIVDNFRMGACVASLFRCALDTYQNGFSPPVFTFDNPDQKMAGNMVATASAVTPNPAKIAKLAPAAGWFYRLLKTRKKTLNVLKTMKGFKLGNKLKSHSRDFGLDVTKATDLAKMIDIINDIGKNPDRIIRGDFAGQGIRQGHNNARGAVDFRIKGNDVVVTKPMELLLRS